MKHLLHLELKQCKTKYMHLSVQTESYLTQDLILREIGRHCLYWSAVKAWGGIKYCLHPGRLRRICRGCEVDIVQTHLCFLPVPTICHLAKLNDLKYRAGLIQNLVLTTPFYGKSRNGPGRADETQPRTRNLSDSGTRPAGSCRTGRTPGAVGPGLALAAATGRYPATVTGRAGGGPGYSGSDGMIVTMIRGTEMRSGSGHFKERIAAG